MDKLKLLSQFIIVLLLTISGTAYAQTTITIDNVEFDATNGIITKYNGSATDIIIPENFMVNGENVTVAGIRYYAFQKCGLTNVSFPNTITSIQFLSFADNLLTSVTLPSGLTELGAGAFTNNNITEINGKPSNGIFLGINEDGTEDDTQLVCFGGTATEIDFIPSTVTVIQSYAFANCSLTSVVIPDGVVAMHDGAFMGNELTTLVLPNSVTTFQSSVFKSNKLTSVTLSENFTSIGYYAFEDNLLTTIEIPEGVTRIGVNAFKDNKLTSVSLPNSLKKIEYRAFLNNEIASITLPGQLEDIDFNAFQFNKLTGLVIPVSVMNIGSSAFGNNTLSSITFEANSNIKTIAGYAFNYNPLLTAIEMPTHADANFDSYVDANGIEYAVGESITDFTTSYRAKIVKTITPDDVSFNTSTGSISNYIGTATDIIIPESFTIDGNTYTIKEIANYTFERSSISSVVFPESLQKIGNSAFYFNSITEITIPENCEVGTSCFTYNKLKTVTIPASMTEIPSSCFAYNDITDINIPSTVTTIGLSAFAYNKITTLTLNEGLEKIGSYAFGLNNLTTLTIPNSVVLVDRSAFSRNKLTEVNLNENVVLAGGVFSSNKIVNVNGEPTDALFYGKNEDGTIDKTKLTSYGGPESIIDFLPDDITVIDDFAFSHCSLNSVDLPPALTHIGYGAFYQSGLNSITIPITLEYIGGSAFSYCNFTSIIFPTSIKYIGSRAFSYCDFTSVTFESESDIEYIGQNAFERNYSLTTPIVLPTSSIPDFINYYDNTGTIYTAGSGFLNIEKACFARYRKTLTLDDVEFDESTGTITDYYGSATDIVIPESFTVEGQVVAVTNIGEQAFYNNNLFSVKIANSVTTIKEKAFYNNSLMEEVVLGNSLITIGQNAFGGSIPASGIELPNTGTWHTSYSYSLGSEVTKIESGNAYKYNHVVYTVNFVDHDGTVLKTQTVMLAASATAPASPTRTGYTFTGWDVDFDSITEDITVTAQYDVSAAIENITSKQYSVYPNPVKDFLHIDMDNTQDGTVHQISIYTISGQLVYSSSDSGIKNKIPVSNWNAGVYYIKVDNIGTKFIKL